MKDTTSKDKIINFLLTIFCMPLLILAWVVIVILYGTASIIFGTIDAIFNDD